jgi:hypothetical protein
MPVASSRSTKEGVGGGQSVQDPAELVAGGAEQPADRVAVDWPAGPAELDHAEQVAVSERGRVEP